MIEKILSRILLESSSCKAYKLFSPSKEDVAELNAYKKCYEIVQEVAKEYGNGWIPCSERLPSREECGRYGTEEFQVTIPQPNGNKTVVMDYEYATIRGKQIARWKWNDRISPWEVLSWKPLDAPYQKGEPKKDCNTCANNTDFDEVDNGCYMCCKGLENNYVPKNAPYQKGE